MPRHDFQCPECGTIREVYLPITERAGSAVVECFACTAPGGVPFFRQMQWLPKIGRMDVQGGGGFTGFDTYVKGPDGIDRLTHVDSLHTLRKIERETEKAWADGLGQPLRWRAYANDHSNQDRNTFGPDPGQIVRAELAAAQADLKGRRDHLKTLRGEDAKRAGDVLGPGVSESTASPLETIDFTPSGDT